MSVVVTAVTAVMAVMAAAQQILRSEAPWRSWTKRCVLAKGHVAPITTLAWQGAGACDIVTADASCTVRGSTALSIFSLALW